VIVAIAIAVALACIAASIRRLWFATHATAIHPGDLLAPGVDVIARLRAVASSPEGEWERDLVAALEAKPDEARTALVNEQLMELDHRIGRWALVPRVCASIATATGIMCGTWILRNGALTAEIIDENLVKRVLADAVAVACLGIAGTVFCITSHTRARRLTRERLAAFDKIIEKLEEAR
jgi:hypothetical protein